MWTYEYTAEYITETISKAASDAAVYEYRANDTICEAGNYTTVRSPRSSAGWAALIWGGVLFPFGPNVFSLASDPVHLHDDAACLAAVL